MNDLSTALARQHVRSLRSEACLDRLQRLAACCRPSTVRRAGTAVLRWFEHGQLGPVTTR